MSYNHLLGMRFFMLMLDLFPELSRSSVHFLAHHPPLPRVN